MQYRERQAVRLCLKHLRQFDFPEAFEALHKRARVDLEHPLLSQLYTLLVGHVTSHVTWIYVSCDSRLRGVTLMLWRGQSNKLWRVCAQTIPHPDPYPPSLLLCVCVCVCVDGFMDAYLSRQPIEAQWTQIETKWTGNSLHPLLSTRMLATMCATMATVSPLECPPGAAGRSAGGTPQRVGPGMRGGHQMCLDPGAELLYLYGGWDGSCDLGDLWRFDIRATQWACLCQDSSSVVSESHSHYSILRCPHSREAQPPAPATRCASTWPTRSSTSSAATWTH